MTYYRCCVAGLLALLAGMGSMPALSQDPVKHDDPPLKLPGWWKASDPLPNEKSNCVRCHLTAGRELTVPLRDFARSVHDRISMSCNDCHGGNTEADATAHEPEHGFIGTKMSAHLTTCMGCHSEEAREVRKSKHHWDWKKRINRDYPACIDCHGNHDVGKPPKEFALTNVCTDCHKDFKTKMPVLAALTTENDRLWAVLRQVHARSKDKDPTPTPFRAELADVRRTTAEMIHGTTPVQATQADKLNQQVIRLREGLEKWLAEQK